MLSSFRFNSFGISATIAFAFIMAQLALNTVIFIISFV
ncbi:hypothetical protein LEP1GSC186_3146 [Leptospira noguchii serovar Autumnalis str. ZUN142]|uniref:Uncharacterized protein n=1 Tax=Leptospira noguchii serovar Autumnalis str. ZUN142 TaxID=1085540 RepID=M6U8R8_9LEPT|nr:hypothetical protein LEP1GSC186_3146 [Leptospira noguchii serovar Autumnalis str. ZUN142]